MSRRYTAQEMREMATEAEVIEVPDQFCGHDMDTIAAMLRQAADDLGRERRYEYAVKVTDIQDKDICGIYKCSDLQNAKDLAEHMKDPENIVTVVRRELVDWEEEDGHGDR